jgi:hypothetical protein
MNKAAVCCLFSCLLTTTAHTQTAPKVVFTGDNFMNAWQQTPQFTANKNWTGAGIQVPPLFGPGSKAVEADFHAAVVSQIRPSFRYSLGPPTSRLSVTQFLRVMPGTNLRTQ